MAEPAKNTDQANQPATQAPALSSKKEIIDAVETRIESYQKAGKLHFPPNYSPQNALKSAWLIIQDTEDRNGKPALEVCKRDSVINALLDMSIQGLNPAKDQCYFIVHGNKLTERNSYFGTVMVAMRVGHLPRLPVAQHVYEGDTFEYDIEDGIITKIRHNQKPENIDPNKIKYTYATMFLPDGTKQSTVMTISEIRTCWEMGELKGKGKAHIMTPGEMAKRTVLNRACKLTIKASDDSDLLLVEAFQRGIGNAEAKADLDADENQNSRVTDVSYMVEAADQQQPGGTAQAQPTQSDPAASAQPQGEIKQEQTKF